MSRHTVQTHTLSISPQHLAAALADPAFAMRRLTAARREDPVLLSHSAGPEQIRIVAKYFTRRDELPGWMQSRFPEHGPENVRTELWKITPEGLTATVDIEATGNGTTVRGTYRVVPTATGAQWQVEATAKAGVPLIGRRIEAYVLESLERAYAAEAQEMSATADIGDRAKVRIA